MNESNSKSLQKTLTLAATLTALGASIGVPSNALGFTMIENPSTEKNTNAGAVQAKMETGATQMKEKNFKQGASVGASQLKIRQLRQNQGVGANQLKFDGKGNAPTGAIQNNQLPAVQR